MQDISNLITIMVCKCYVFIPLNIEWISITYLAPENTIHKYISNVFISLFSMHLTDEKYFCWPSHSGTWVWNLKYTEGAVKSRYSLWAFSLFSQVESIHEMIIVNILLLINDVKPFECTRISTILCPEIQFLFSKQNFAFLFDQVFHVFCQIYANFTALNSNMKMALLTFYNKI